MLKPPPASFTAHYIIRSYNRIVRARRYVECIPSELSIHDVNAFCSAYGCDIQRHIFDDCIFALDDAVLKEASEKRKPTNAKDNT